MGFAGTLGSGWNDYLLGDTISTPVELVSSELWRKRRGVSPDPNVPLLVDSPTSFEGNIDPEEDSSDWM